MKRETLQVIIGKDGTMRIESSGFNGSVCSKEIAKFISGKVTDDVKKPEFYEEDKPLELELTT